MQHEVGRQGQAHERRGNPASIDPVGGGDDIVVDGDVVVEPRVGGQLDDFVPGPRRYQRQGDADDDHGRHHGGDVPPGEGGFTDRDGPAELGGNERAFRRSGEGTGAGVTHVPDNVTGISGRHQHREVQAQTLLPALDGYLFGQQDADHKSQPPSDQRGGRGGHEDKQIPLERGLGQATEAREDLAHRSGVRQRMAQQQDQRHLRHKRQQAGEPVAPPIDDFHKRGFRQDQGEDAHDEGQYDGEDESAGNKAFDY